MSSATISPEAPVSDRPVPDAPPRAASWLGRSRFHGWLTIGAQLVVCTLAVIIASAGFQPFFADPAFLLPAAGAAVLGAVCGVAVGHLRRPPILWWVLTPLAFITYLIYVVFPGTTNSGVPGVASVRAVADGLLHGVARMLTITPPADTEAVLLIVPVTLAFVASFAAAMLIRYLPVLLPLLPPLLVFLAALVLSANAQQFQWQVTIAFLLCAFVIILLRANTSSNSRDLFGAGTITAAPAVPVTQEPKAFWHGTAGRVLFGVPLIAVVVALAAVGVNYLPVADGASRFDVRELRERPLNLQNRLNPLVDVRRQIEEQSTATVFTIRPDDGGPLPVDRIRVAALDRYDGVQWTSGAEFVRTGSTLPVGSGIDNPRTVTVDVTLTGAFTPPFLPEFGQPRRVEAEDLGFDPPSGLLVTGSRALDGYHYRLTAAVPVGDLDPATAVPADGPDVDRWRELPQGIEGDPGAGLAALAAQVASGTGSAYDKLQHIADHLKSSTWALDAAPGHSYAALDRLVPTAPANADHRVTEEQTVAAFVIMARSLGYPARVAVGYRVDPATAVDGTYSVRVSDADAWAEVAFAGRGWVAFSPTAPRDRPPPPPPPPLEAANPEGPTEVVRPDIAGPDVALDSSSGIGIPWAIALTILIPLLVILLLVATVVAIKQFRRNRRRTAGTTSDRIMGAWRESTNRLRENGFVVPDALTPGEVGDRTAERFGAEAGKSVTTMEPLLAEAVYAQEQPDEDAVVRAWDLEAELRSILDGRRPLVKRWLTWIDPRPLLPGGSKREALRSPADDSRQGR